jgi:Ulp1 family protease
MPEDGRSCCKTCCGNIDTLLTSVLLIIVLQIRPLQMNGYDCGVWVLAHIAVALHGFHTADMTEDSIAKMRRFLAVLVSQLPLQQAS